MPLLIFAVLASDILAPLVVIGLGMILFIGVPLLMLSLPFLLVGGIIFAAIRLTRRSRARKRQRERIRTAQIARMRGPGAYFPARSRLGSPDGDTATGLAR